MIRSYKNKLAVADGSLKAGCAVLWMTMQTSDDLKMQTPALERELAGIETNALAN